MILYRRSFVRMVLVLPVAIAGCQSPDGSFGVRHSDWMSGGLNNSSMWTDRPMPKLLPATYYAAGRLFEKQGQLEHAARKYSEAVTVNHEYMAAYNRLGIVLTQLGRFEKADDALIRAIELAPDKAFLRNNLAFSYILQKRWADGEAELANALHLNPNFVRARVNMGMVQAKQARFADALGTFRTVLPEADAYYNMGMLFNSVQRYQDAATVFERAKTLQPAMTAAQTQLDALASHLADPRPNEPRAVFTKDGIADAPIEQASPVDVPETEVAVIDEPEIKPETMPELKTEGEADSPEAPESSLRGELAKADRPKPLSADPPEQPVRSDEEKSPSAMKALGEATAQEQHTADTQTESAPQAEPAEKESKVAAAAKTETPKEPQADAPEKEVASAADSKKESAPESPTTTEKPATDEAIAKAAEAEPTQAASDIVGPPAPLAEDLDDLDDNEQELVLHFEHDRPDLTTESKEVTDEVSPTTADQVARADLPEPINEVVEVVMAKESVEPESAEPASNSDQTSQDQPEASSGELNAEAAEASEPDESDATEKDADEADEVDEADEDQVSSAAIDSPMGDEANEEQADSADSDADQQSVTRTLVTITVQPQIVPEEDGEADADEPNREAAEALESDGADATEKNADGADEADGVDEADENQVSSAAIDSPMGDEANEAQVDSAALDADQQPITRTLVTITVQPQMAPENDGEASSDEPDPEAAVALGTDESDATEKDPDEADGVDEADVDQISSAAIDSPMEDEANEEQVDSPASDADQQPITRTLVTITVQPQIAPEKEGEADVEEATTEQPTVVAAESDTSAALEELMVDHADQGNQEETPAKTDDDLAEAPSDKSEQAGELVVDNSENNDKSEVNETSSTSDVSERVVSPIVQGRKHPLLRRRSERNDKLMIALYFDHHRPDFTSIPTAGGGDPKGVRNIAGRIRDGAADVPESGQAVPGQAVAAASAEKSAPEGESDGTDDPKTSPADVIEPQDPEAPAASINKAPIRILVTQRISDEDED